eukprot:scaffold5050_cov18-Tisochrysis_lutea.AAC.4
MVSSRKELEEGGRQKGGCLEGWLGCEIQTRNKPTSVRGPDTKSPHPPNDEDGGVSSQRHTKIERTCDLALTKYSVRLRLGFSTLQSTAMRGLMFCSER